MGSLQSIRADTPVIHGSRNAVYTTGSIDFADFTVARFLNRINFISAQKLEQQIVKEVGSRAMLLCL